MIDENLIVQLIKCYKGQVYINIQTKQLLLAIAMTIVPKRNDINYY